MKRSASGLLEIFVIAAIAVSGCVAMEQDLVRDKSVNLEKISSDRGLIASVSVVQQGSTIRISGLLRSRNLQRGHIPGRIKLQLIAPDGTVLEKRTINYEEVSRLSEYAMFNFVTRLLLPKGSTIRVIHDDTS